MTHATVKAHPHFAEGPQLSFTFRPKADFDSSESAARLIMSWPRWNSKWHRATRMTLRQQLVWYPRHSETYFAKKRHPLTVARILLDVFTDVCTAQEYNSDYVGYTLSNQEEHSRPETFSLKRF